MINPAKRCCIHIASSTSTQAHAGEQRKGKRTTPPEAYQSHGGTSQVIITSLNTIAIAAMRPFSHRYLFSALCLSCYVRLGFNRVRNSCCLRANRTRSALAPVAHVSLRSYQSDPHASSATVIIHQRYFTKVAHTRFNTFFSSGGTQKWRIILAAS